MKSSRRLSLAALCALSSVSAYALQPLNTDDAGTVGAGGNQIELSVTRERARQAGISGRDRTTEVPFSYTRGLTETLDLSIGIGHLRNRPGFKDENGATGKKTSGMGNTEIGAKWRFFENKDSETSLAIAPTLVLPVSKSRQADDLGTGRVSGSVALLLSQDVPFGAVHVNAGLGKNRYRQLRDAAGDPANATSETTRNLSFAPVWEVSKTFQLAADLGVEWSKANKRESEEGGWLGKSHTTRTRYLGLGAIWTPQEDVDVTLGVFRYKDNESQKTTTNSLTAGLTFRF